MENRIRKLLLQAGVDPSLSGYDYLMTGLQMCYEDRSLFHHVTKELYWMIAEKHKVKASNVERCMRHVIENMKRTDCSWFRKEVIGLVEDKRKLTNTQFLAICVEILKMQEDEENVK